MTRIFINQINNFYNIINIIYIFAYTRQTMKINLNTLKYVVAVDSHRNFVKAAEACGVSQPALSAAIKNMEEELDTVIFDRNSHPARPTPSGEKIISMARATLRNASMIEEFVLGERGGTGGEVSIGTIPTVAPYVLPGLFREMRDSWPDVCLKVSEMRTASLMEKLRSDEIDIAIMSTPLGQKGLLEIPLYYEKFFAYVSPSDELYALEEIPSEKLASERFWILEEGHCLRSQVLNFCSGSRRSHTEYQAGSIDTLVRVVDMNGGYTVIPELHLPFLDVEQKKNIRPIVKPESRKTGQAHRQSGEASSDRAAPDGEGQCPACIPVREVSLVISEHFVRERMLNVIADCIRKIIPDNMTDSRLKRFAIRL